MTGSVQIGIWVTVTATFGTMAVAGWSMGWLHRRMSWPEWFIAGVVVLFCFLPPTTVLPVDLRDWQIKIVGKLGLAAIYQWQRMRPYVGVKVGTA